MDATIPSEYQTNGCAHTSIQTFDLDAHVTVNDAVITTYHRDTVAR
jgi:hypothetical protein